MRGGTKRRAQIISDGIDLAWSSSDTFNSDVEPELAVVLPRQLAADVMVDMAAALPGVQTSNKRAAEMPPQRASSAKRPKPEECAATWAAGHDVVVEYASNLGFCTPAAADFPTCMEQDGHDVIVQDASPAFLKSLLSAS